VSTLDKQRSSNATGGGKRKTFTGKVTCLHCQKYIGHPQKGERDFVVADEGIRWGVNLTIPSIAQTPPLADTYMLRPKVTEAMFCS
jgi:hypothetical protein